MPNIPTYSVVNVCVALLTILSVPLSAYDWTLRVNDVRQPVTERKENALCSPVPRCWHVHASVTWHGGYVPLSTQSIYTRTT